MTITVANMAASRHGAVTDSSIETAVQRQRGRGRTGEWYGFLKIQSTSSDTPLPTRKATPHFLIFFK